MTDHQKRTCCYAVMFLMVAIDNAMIGAALFLTLMDYISTDQQNTKETP